MAQKTINHARTVPIDRLLEAMEELVILQPGLSNQTILRLMNEGKAGDDKISRDYFRKAFLGGTKVRADVITAMQTLIREAKEGNLEQYITKSKRKGKSNDPSALGRRKRYTIREREIPMFGLKALVARISDTYRICAEELDAMIAPQTAEQVEGVLLQTIRSRRKYCCWDVYLPVAKIIMRMHLNGTPLQAVNMKGLLEVRPYDHREPHAPGQFVFGEDLGVVVDRLSCERVLVREQSGTEHEYADCRPRCKSISSVTSGQVFPTNAGRY